MNAYHSPVVGSIIFGAPLLVWGALACLVPIIIHLVHRQRPRHQVFPAMRFLLASSKAATRAHRLKHLILLACRVLVVLLLVALLARTTWLPESAAISSAFLSTGNEPVCAAICLDNSASMSYRYQGRTRLKRAVQWATLLLKDTERFPSGSQILVLDGSAATVSDHGTTNRQEALEKLATVQQADHGRRVRPLLECACRKLRTAELDRREIYLLTDMTTQAWQGDPPAIPDQINAVYVLDVGREEHQNAALNEPIAPKRIISADRSERITIGLRTFDLTFDPVVELRVDGQTRDRQAVGPMGKNEQVDVTLTMPALDRGLHSMEISLQPDDAMGIDNSRFLSVRVGHPPEILVIAGRGNNEVGTLLAAMISPTAAEPSDQRFVVERTLVEQISQINLADRLAVVLADPDPLDTNDWTDLAEYVRTGGHLIVFPGPNTSLRTYAQDNKLLPAATLSLLKCPEPISMAVTDYAHPMLAELADPGIDSINDRMVFQRLTLADPREGASILVPFSDRAPAVLTRQVGSGQIILFATSPARTWSQLGSRAAPMIVMIHSLLNSLLSPPADALTVTVDDRLNTPADTKPNTQLERVADDTRQTIESSDDPRLPTQYVGNYHLRDKGGNSLLYYSVNTPESESDPTRITARALANKVPKGRIAIAENQQKLELADRKPHHGIEMTVPIGIILLALLVIETLLANRFYGKANDSTNR